MENYIIIAAITVVVVGMLAFYVWLFDIWLPEKGRLVKEELEFEAEKDRRADQAKTVAPAAGSNNCGGG